MVYQLVAFSCLIVAAQCMFLHPAPLPVLLAPIQPYPEPKYSFAYDVNDARTGDVKSQHESRRGDIVIGQYSLVQPDGIKRTVDYTANDNTGFLATVNNQGRPVNQESVRRYNIPEQPTRASNNKAQKIQFDTASTASYSTQSWSDSMPSVTPAPVSISRSPVVHPSFSNGHNSWL